MLWILQTSELSRKDRVSVGARDLFNLMDSVTVCTHFGSNQPPFSLKITNAASLIRRTLAIRPTNLLKQDLTY